jgi:hypothetical protein
VSCVELSLLNWLYSRAPELARLRWPRLLEKARTYFSGELPDRCDGASKSRLHHVVRMKADGTIGYSWEF